MMYLFGFLLFLTSTFLILLVLVQRGRGGGLAGALGGPGGQSAFGAKAGDTFTWITVFTAAFWGLLCVGTILYFNRTQKVLNSNEPGNAVFSGAGAGSSDKKDDTKGDTKSSDSK